MYILYNRDGSIRKVNLTDFIQKGNDDINTIFLGIACLDNSQWSPSVFFELPNDEIVLNTPALETRDIEGETYSGYLVSVTADVTVYEGIVKFSLRVKNLQEITLFTYETKLVINPATIIPDQTRINVTQYEQLLAYILSVRNPINEIAVIDNLATYDFSAFSEGQVFLDKNTKKFYKRIAIEPYYELYPFSNYYVVATSSTTFKELADINHSVIVRYDSTDYLLSSLMPFEGVYVFSIINLTNPLIVFTSNGNGVEIDNTVLFRQLISSSDNPYLINSNKYYAGTIVGEIVNNILKLSLKSKDETTILDTLELPLPNVRYDTSEQGLTDEQKSNARNNIGAGTSNFSGSYNDLTNKPTYYRHCINIAFTNSQGQISFDIIDGDGTPYTDYSDIVGYFVDAFIMWSSVDGYGDFQIASGVIDPRGETAHGIAANMDDAAELVVLNQSLTCEIIDDREISITDRVYPY